LQYYGSLFFASTQNFEEQLPQSSVDTSYAVVILNLRGQQHLDSSSLNILIEYAQKLQQHNCRLMLAGVGAAVLQTLEKTGKLAIIGSDNVFAVSEHYLESVLQARAEAEEWTNK
jgi:SulP family sulfate permease